MIRSNLSPDLALSEAKEMLGHGTDSTSVTLAYILWALAHDFHFQELLVLDLAAAGWPTEWSKLEEIPRLKAAVKEGIRWTGAAAAMLPRIVPDGGALLAGQFIPGGVSISPPGSSTLTVLDCDWELTYSVPAREDCFSSPERYRPTRWLDDEQRPAASNNLRDDFYIPISTGSNTCIGKQ
jgi:cytochrome P450